MSRRTVYAGVVFLLLVLAMAACGDTGGTGETVGTDSGVQGEVRISPLNPVEQPGVENDGPYSATLRFRRASDGKLIAETTSDEEGLFRVALPPDAYTLEPVNGDPLPTAPPQQFIVLPGQFTTLRVDYDSGIR
jgi:hypothetical protein